MNAPVNNLVRHLDPNTDTFNLAGIALAADGHDPQDVRDFYNNSGCMPDVHPAVLYEVKRRGQEGDKLTRTFISLPNERVLEIGTHFLNILYGGRRFDAAPDDIELARGTLEQIGLLSYSAKAVAGDGRKLEIPINVSGQIENLLGMHLAVPVRES